MIDSKLRKHVQPVFERIGKVFEKTGITPNQMTVAAFVLGIAGVVLVAFKLNYWAFGVLALSGFIDILDGTLARIKNVQSKKGAFLDLIFDKLVEVLFILGLAIAYPKHYITYIVFLILVILTKPMSIIKRRLSLILKILITFLFWETHSCHWASIKKRQLSLKNRLR